MKEADTSRPSPALIRQWREAAGLSQMAAAELVHRKLRQWQRWEAGAAYDAAALELFLRKTDQTAHVQEWFK